MELGGQQLVLSLSILYDFSAGHLADPTAIQHYEVVATSDRGDGVLVPARNRDLHDIIGQLSNDRAYRGSTPPSAGSTTIDDLKNAVGVNPWGNLTGFEVRIVGAGVGFNSEINHFCFPALAGNKGFQRRALAFC